MSFEGKSVLLVEQDADIAMLMEHILESAGCDVHRSTPANCLSDIHFYHPGVILLDQFTCSTTPSSMCTLLKDIQTAHIPVILTSTSVTLQKINCGCKVDDFVAKPFDIDDLEHKVLYWLSLNQGTSVN